MGDDGWRHVAAALVVSLPVLGGALLWWARVLLADGCWLVLLGVGAGLLLVGSAG